LKNKENKGWREDVGIEPTQPLRQKPCWI